MRLLPLALLPLFGCSAVVGVSNQGCCIEWSVIDTRIGQKLCSAGDVRVGQTKEAMSQQHAELVADILPDVVAAAVKVALDYAAGPSQAVGIPVQVIRDAAVKALEDAEADKAKTRRTPEEKAENRAAREAESGRSSN